mgnify:CR=1 FL=1
MWFMFCCVTIAKRKLDLVKNPATGGGPAPPPFSEVESACLDLMEEAGSVLDGIDNSVDSIVPVYLMFGEFLFS